jgi:hypothetical protein
MTELFTRALRRTALVACLTPQLLAAQKTVVAESDPDIRRQALIGLWDAVPGSTDARSGMSYAKWLAANGNAFARLSVPVPAAGRWASIGPLGFYGDNGFFGSLPQLDAGRVPTLAFHPTDRNTLYIGTAAGGVWKSTNEGASWVPLTDGQCSLVIGAIAIDPVNPDIVYAGTGDFSEVTAGCGVLRSTDGGATWTTFGTSTFNTSVAASVTFFSIVIDRASAGSVTSTTLLASTNRGLYRSTNSGQTWTLITAALTFSDAVQHPTDPNIMYAARYGVVGSATPPGLWRSNDRGATWTAVSTFLADSVARMEIAVSAARPGSVWIVASRQDSRFGGLYRWDDATGTRTTLDGTGVTAAPAVSGRNNFGSQGNYDLMIAVDQQDSDVIYLGGVRAYQSVNGGLTFSEIAPQIHCDWHVILVDPNDSRRVFAGSDGGVFLSRDRAASFLSVNMGLATSLHYAGMSLHPTDPTGVLTGMQDNGTIIARNGLVQWNGVNGGDGSFTAINPASPDIYYVSSQNGNMIRVNGAAGTARSINGGIDAAERRAFIAPFIIDPQRPTRLYFGGARVYRTANEGTLWTPISLDLTRGSGTISAMAISPSDSTVLFVGTSDGNVRFTRDFGVTWQAPSTTLPARSITDFAIDPADPNKVVVTLGSSGTPHVYLSRDGGQTWSDITGSLPDVTTQAAAWGPAGKLYIGNMLGVYETANDGVSWTKNDGLPVIRVTDLVYNPRTNRLVAATYGRGVWAYDFTTAAPVLRGDVNGDGTVNAADALLIQQALIGAQLPASATLFPTGDANCDGKLDVLDALMVLKFAVGDVVAGSCVGTRR